MQNDPDISIILPVFNEEGVLEELLTKISDSLSSLNRSHEIICVNDGSTDGSFEIINTYAAKNPNLKILSFSENMGQTAALDAGIHASRGTYVILMDADLQHDPDEIFHFVEGLDQGYDIVSGWRKKRVDGFVSRRVPSLIANRLMRFVSGINLHDFGTTYKGYRGEMLRSISLYSPGFHRFIPVLLKPYRPRLKEVPIKNTVRSSGISAYGIGRVFVVFWDIIKLGFLTRFASRPMDCVGPAALLLLMTGGVVLSGLLMQKILYDISIIETHGILLVLSALFILVGVQLLSLGLLMELILYYVRQRN